jgi:hypothetical protein
VVRCQGCAGNCPLESAGPAASNVVMGFHLRGVPPADVRHLPVHDEEGRLLGIIHLLSPVEWVTT